MPSPVFPPPYAQCIASPYPAFLSAGVHDDAEVDAGSGQVLGCADENGMTGQFRNLVSGEAGGADRVFQKARDSIVVQSFRLQN